MFGFMGMMDDYEDRKIARYDDEKTGLMVSTCSVTDSSAGYETAIEHPSYNGGHIIIVEEYTSVEKAKKGHAKWKKKGNRIPFIMKKYGRDKCYICTKDNTIKRYH